MWCVTYCPVAAEAAWSKPGDAKIRTMVNFGHIPTRPHPKPTPYLLNVHPTHRFHCHLHSVSSTGEGGEGGEGREERGGRRGREERGGRRGEGGEGREERGGRIGEEEREERGGRRVGREGPLES